MKARTVVSLVLLGVTLAAASLIGRAGASPDPVQLAQLATEKYRSVAQAEADGYVRASPCVASPAGGMGFHYVHPGLMADPALDPLRPEILVYVPKGPRAPLKLAALEWLKADADGSLLTDGDRPSLFGQPFDGPMPGHAPGEPVHYDLHVWTFKKNESGLFAQWNPAVRCE